MTRGDELAALAERVLATNKMDLKLDVLCEIALFTPDQDAVSIRSNHAGTKVIYTDYEGKDLTCWPQDWTARICREKTAAALLARAQEETKP